MTTQDQLTGTTSGPAPDPKVAAREESRHLKDEAGHEARQVLDEARSQARHVLDDARMQLEEQSRGQRDKLVHTLDTLAADLDRMCGQAESGLAADLTRELADKARTMSRTLSQREPEQLVDQVRDFARRRPGLFLAGALAAGVAAGRLMRGAQGAKSSTSAAGQRSGGTPYPVPAQPTGPGAAAPAAPRKHHGDPLLPTEAQGTPSGTPPGTPTGGPAQEAGLHDDWPGERGGLR